MLKGWPEEQQNDSAPTPATSLCRCRSVLPNGEHPIESVAFKSEPAASLVAWFKRMQSFAPFNQKGMGIPFRLLILAMFAASFFELGEG